MCWRFHIQRVLDNAPTPSVRMLYATPRGLINIVGGTKVRAVGEGRHSIHAHAPARETLPVSSRGHPTQGRAARCAGRGREGAASTWGVSEALSAGGQSGGLRR